MTQGHEEVVIVEHSADGHSWIQLGEWPVRLAAENWRQLREWIGRTQVVGFLRRRKRSGPADRGSYPRLSDAAQAGVLKRLGRGDPDADCSD